MKTVDISGFGGSYEAGCQKMLLQGLEFLNNHPNFNWEGYKQYKNIYGLCTAKTDEAKALDEAVCTGVEPSGAMHQAVINHLAYIHKHGYDNWIAEAEKQGATVYEQASEEELNKIILISQIEWQLKLDAGYNPMAELLKNIPMEDVISIDPNDADSIRKAAEEIARRIEKFNSS